MGVMEIKTESTILGLGFKGHIGVNWNISCRLNPKP